MAPVFVIDTHFFNNDAYIEARLVDIPPLHRGAMRTALLYLYCDSGPINLDRDRLRIAKNYLSHTEQIVAQWLSTRTNGSLRKSYGAAALRAARSSRYRCEHCGFSDVRTLNLDHVDGRVKDAVFACLCANCHTIKSRERDWTGKKRVHPAS